MNSLKKAFSTSIAQKYLVGITGFFLILFVLGHLAGNLLLYVGLDVYNSYAHSLHKNQSLLYVVELILLTLFVLHVSMAVRVSRKNRQARPQDYAMRQSKQGRTSMAPSNVMLISGSVVLGFILLHLSDLRFNLRHPVAPGAEPATHTLLVLQDPISATVYFFGSLLLGWHLWHAFESMFQTYGLNHPYYTPKIRKLGIILAVALGLGFASFPVYGILLRLGVLS